MKIKSGHTQLKKEFVTAFPKWVGASPEEVQGAYFLLRDGESFLGNYKDRALYEIDEAIGTVVKIRRWARYEKDGYRTQFVPFSTKWRLVPLDLITEDMLE